MSTATPTAVGSAGTGIARPDGSRSSAAAPPPRTRGRIVDRLAGDNAKLWLRRKAVAMWMNLLIVGTAVLAILTAGVHAGHPLSNSDAWGVAALKLFALWCLAFLPGWLYVRFLGMRARALWNEYVLNLHRLGWDRPWHLPEPPLASDFHQQWERGPNRHRRSDDNIYQQKFEAYYGRQIPQAVIKAGRNENPDDTHDYLVSSESLFPVFLATAVLAAGWTAVLWDTRFVVAPSGTWDALKYGFLGAYAFVTGMLLRRFFQSDLRPSAYASAVLRIILVLLIVTVLQQVIGGNSAAGNLDPAIAFVIGFFPLVGLQLLQRLTSRALRQLVPPVTSEYPLDQLDGLNLWYEARLLEEGVEDMQNLTTMNLVDVILHTRVPAGRLVDWTDQAFLLIHLDRTDRAELDEERKRDRGPADEETGAVAGAPARARLRRYGVRTATDLLKVFSVEDDGPGGEAPQRRYARPVDVERLPLPEDQLRLLVAVLVAEPGLGPVWNWQRNGVRTCGNEISSAS
jgi:hypothetical protein